MFGGIFNHEARFFTDGYELSGVESVDFSYNNAANILKPLGTKRGLTTASGPTQQTLAFSRVLTYDDPIIDYASDTPMSGSVFYDDRYYGFDTGYLTDYSVNCAVGAVPRVSCNFQVASEMKSGVDTSLPVQQHPDIDIPTQGSISITCDGSTTNRVVGFDYGIKCNRKAYYSIGSNEVQKVELIQPVEYNATVQIEVDDAFLSDAYNFFSNKETKNISLDIKGRTGAQIQTALIPNATLVGESLNVGADGIAKVTLNYIGHSGILDSSINGRETYVYDEAGTVLQSTPNEVPYQWMEGSGDIYNVSFGQDCSYISGYAFSGCSNLGGDIHIGVVGDYSGIGEAAFADCTGLDGEVYFPKSAEIGDYAFKNCGIKGDLLIKGFGNYAGKGIFENCSGLDGRLTYPAPKDNLDVRENSFKNCSNLIGNLTIPSGITDYDVESGAFENCSSLDGNISIGDKNVSVEENAFKNCSSLVGALNFPNTNTSIGDGAFENCSKIKSLDLSTSINYLGDNAFKNCSEIGGTVDLTSLAAVGSGAFENCKKITTLKLDDTTEYFGSRSFYGCEGLVNLDSATSFYNVTEFGDKAFMNCSSLISECDTEKATGIGASAFENCKNIYGDIDLHVATNVGKRAFYGCSSLTGNIVCDTTISTINDETFKDCGFKGFVSFDNTVSKPKAETVYAKNSSITSIGNKAFENCDFDCNLNLPIDLENVGDGAFKDCESLTGRLVMPTGVTGIGDRAFYNCNSIEDVILNHDTGVFQGERAFEGIQGCMYISYPYVDDYVEASAGLLYQGMPICIGSLDTTVYNQSTKVLIDSETGDVPLNFYINKPTAAVLTVGFNATAIGNNAFYNSDGLKGGLRIPSSVKTIGTQAFYDCNGLTEYLIIENGVETFGTAAFRGCHGFSGSLTIPESMTDFGDSAFRDCYGFDGNLFIEATGLTIIQDHAFYNCNKFIGDIVIPEGVTQIGASSFELCSGFSGILSLPEELTEIKSDAFNGCGGLIDKVVFPKSLTSIGSSAFLNCSGIEDVSFGDNLLTIGANSFQNCSSLSKPIVINSGVASIGASAFKGCSSVPSIYIDIPNTSLGTDSLDLSENPTSDKILYVRSDHAAGYSAAGSPVGYYDGNLLAPWEDDERPTRVYESNFSIFKELYETTITQALVGGGAPYPAGRMLSLGYNVNTIGDDTFKNVINLVGTITIPSNVAIIGNNAFDTQDNITHIFFNEGLQQIGTAAFANFTALDGGLTVDLPSTLDSIGFQAFYNSSDLEKLKIGDDITPPTTTIGGQAFAKSAGTTTVAGAFVEVGKSVLSIGTNCFAHSKFETATIKANTVDSLSFENCNFTHIHFTDDVKTFSKNTIRNVRPTNSANLTVEIGVDGGASQDIPDKAFWQMTDTDSSTYRYVYVEIKDSVNIIGERAFQGKAGDNTGTNNRRFLRRLEVNAREIQFRAFWYQTPIFVDFGKNVQVIGNQAFRNCTIFSQDLVFEHNPIRIEKQAFGDFGDGAAGSMRNDCDNVYLCSRYKNSTADSNSLPDPYVNFGKDSGDPDNQRSFLRMAGDFFVHPDHLPYWPNLARRNDSTVDIKVREWENYPDPNGVGDLRSDIEALALPENSWWPTITP